MEKVDYRIFRTKRDLRNALLGLLETNSFEKISVKDICDYAHINKMTFYRHYDDKYDLLQDTINNIADGIYQKCSSLLSKTDIKTIGEACANITAEVVAECFNRKKEILSIIDSSNSLGAEVLNGTIESIVNHLVEKISTIYQIKYNKEYISAFIVGGYSALMSKILRGKPISKDVVIKEVSSIYQDLLSSNLIIKH